MHPSSELQVPEQESRLYALHVMEKYAPSKPLIITDHDVPPKEIARISLRGRTFKLTHGQNDDPGQTIRGTRQEGALWAAVYRYHDDYVLSPVDQAPGKPSETIQTQILPPLEQNLRRDSGTDPFTLQYIIAGVRDSLWKYRIVGPPGKPDGPLKPTLNDVHIEKFTAQHQPPTTPRPKLTHQQQELLEKTTRTILYGKAEPAPKPPDQKPDVPRPPDAQKIKADALALLRKLDITEQRVDVQPVDSLQKPRRTLTDLATIGIKPNLYTLLLPHSKELVRLLKPRILRRGTTEARITRSTHTLIYPDIISVKRFNPKSGSRLDQEPIGISWYDSHIIFTGPLESLEHFLDVAIHSK